MTQRFRGLWNRLTRARFFRGHGVHSPFVYAIVREVFMCRRLRGSDASLSDALLAAGVPAQRANELQNLMMHCGYRTFAVCRGAHPEPAGAELLVLSEDMPEAETLRLMREAEERGAAVAVMAPYADADRIRMCRSIVASHRSTTVDNRGYLLVFNDEKLPKQHFRI